MLNHTKTSFQQKKFDKNNKFENVDSKYYY